MLFPPYHHEVKILERDLKHFLQILSQIYPCSKNVDEIKVSTLNNQFLISIYMYCQQTFNRTNKYS